MRPPGIGRQLVKRLVVDAHRCLVIAGVGAQLAPAAKVGPWLSDDLRRKDTPDRGHRPEMSVRDKANGCIFLLQRR